MFFIGLFFLTNLSFSQNLPPVMDKGIPNQHAEVGEAFFYVIPSNAFKDENHDPLTISVTGSLPGITIRHDTLQGTPTTASTYQLTVTARDAGGLTVARTFTIYVHPAGTTYSAFSMNVQQGCNSLMVNFTNRSKGANSYLWDLGNSNISTLPNPTNNFYGKPGTYTVTLTINEGEPNEASFSETLTVFPKPQPAIDRNLQPGCEPHALTLSSTGSPVNVAPFLYNNYPVGGVTGGSESYYNWYFYGKHPEIFSTNPSVHVSGLQGGLYNVALVVTDDNGCYSAKIENELFEVFDRPDASFSYIKADPCAPS